MRIVIAILIFSAIILIHELGHFLLAKRNGIIVTEFSLGMGPRLFSITKGGTKYSLKAFPLGGSCAMLGEDTDEETLPGSFNAASVWARISVVAAGPLFNFLLAFILSCVIVAVIGYSPAEITQVAEGSQAEAAGLQPGDVITEYQGFSIDIGNDLFLYTYLHPLKADETVTISYERQGKEETVSFVPDVNVRYLLGFNRSTEKDTMEVMSLISGMPLEEAGVRPGDIITGINGEKITSGSAYDAYIKEHPLSDEPVTITYMRDGLDYETEITPGEYRTPILGIGSTGGYVKAQGLDILRYGALEVKYMIRATIMSLGELFGGGLGMKDLSGPVGVVDAIGDTYEESKSQGSLIVWMNMFQMAVLLSANLGVMNLLPFPALDGGRLVFLVLEAIRRKPVNRQLEGMVHFAGLMFLMALMLVVMYNDILKII